MMFSELITDETGVIISRNILRKLEGGLTEEFERLINKDLSEWIPARNEGEAVVSRKIIPIRIKLKG